MARIVKYLKGGVITIPKAIREELGWGPGTELLVEAKSDEIMLVRKPDTADRSGVAVKRRPRRTRP